MKEKYLPIGTIVTLQGATKKIMIVGYCPMDNNKKVYDYSACTYPEGIITADKTLAFNHSQIASIDFMGFESQEQIDFNSQIKTMLAQLETIKQVQFSEDVNVPKTNQIN